MDGRQLAQAAQDENVPFHADACQVRYDLLLPCHASGKSKSNTCENNSSASIFWWCGKGGFADRQCTMDVTLPRWFDARFPPLSIFYGGRDFLVLVDPLLERIRKHEPYVDLIRVEKIDASEVSRCFSLSVWVARLLMFFSLSQHCDFYWAADAVEWCFEAIMGSWLIK